MKQSVLQEDRRRFLKQIGVCIAGTGAISFLPEYLVAKDITGKGLPRSFPEAEGISSAEILRFIETAEKSNAGLHSYMVVRHGKVVAEGWWDPYKPDIKHCLYSLSKNFTSTAIGLAIGEKRLTLDDKVISFFEADKPAAIDANLAALTVRDLLTMTSGHATDTLLSVLFTKDGNWVKNYLSLPIKYEPGTHFVYNSGNTYVLSAILQKITGQTVVDYLQPRLFEPLDIEGAEWDSDPSGINFGAAGLRLKTEDLAKFGQLYLQKGIWKGKRILSGEWVAEATSFKVRNDETGTPTKKEEDDIKQGYGYQFWLTRPVSQGAYMSVGAFCQYSIVMPKQDAIIALTAEGISTKRVLDLCWDILLPAMREGALPSDKTARKKLEEKSKSLKLEAPKSKPASTLSDLVSGKRYKLDANGMNAQSVSFDFRKDQTVFTLKTDKGEFPIVCGIEDWKLGMTSIRGSPTNLLSGIPLFQSVWKVAASGTWEDENTFIMTWRFFETPHYDIVTCKFDKDELKIEYANSITRILNQYKDPRPSLKGKQLG